MAKSIGFGRTGRAFHPVLISLFPLLFTYSRDLMEVDIHVLLRPALWILFCTLVVWFTAWRLSGDWDRAALFTSASALVTFSYGHASRWVGWLPGMAAGQGPEILMLVLWGAAVTLLALACFKWKRRVVPMAGAMNLFAVLLLAYPLEHIINWKFVRGITVAVPVAESNGTGMEKRTRPDIVYIILDGFGRQDILRDMYRHDNREFIDALTHLGFVVASRARSNYGQTMESLASSLNFQYLESMIDSSHIRADDRRPLRALLERNGVFAFLRRQGYDIVCFSSGYTATELPGVDEYLTPRWNLNEFDQFLISLTPLWTAFDLAAPGWQYTLNRERIDFPFRHLSQMPRSDRPRFIFAHVVAPHPPFVFGGGGESVRDVEPLSIDDGSTYISRARKEDYIRRYTEQIQYIESSALSAVRGLLEHQSPPPVIILQGDHGPGSELDWSNAGRTNLHERLSILNALYLPGADSGGVPDDLTPVNTFRLVFNRYFDARLPYLSNRSGFSSWNHPFTYFQLAPEE